MRYHKYLPPLPQEQNVMQFFVHGKEKQEELIENMWKRFMPQRKYAVNQYMKTVMEILIDSDNKAKDLIKIHSCIDGQVSS